MESISTTGITRIDELLFSVDEKLRQTTDPVIEANWRQFRLIGNPFQAIK